MPERLPHNACDTHFHIFGNPATYPVANANALYRPPQECTVAALETLHQAMGIDRAVIVQATIYGTDNRLLHDALSAAPPGRYRGVAIIDDSVSDAELDRLHAVGVRGARFNFGGAFKLTPSLDTLRRSLARIHERGWIAKIFGFGDDFVGVADELRKIKGPAIIDHMGGPDYRRGTSQPAVLLILELLRHDNWWIGLSNGDLRSTQPPPWDDAAEFGQLLYAAAPDRSIWGTDWPHVHRFIRPGAHPYSEDEVAHEMERIALLERYVSDRAARDRVLVDNPARLFGFSG